MLLKATLFLAMYAYIAYSASVCQISLADTSGDPVLLDEGRAAAPTRTSPERKAGGSKNIMSSQTEPTSNPPGTPVRIHIDQKPYESPSPTTGAALIPAGAPKARFKALSRGRGGS